MNIRQKNIRENNSQLRTKTEGRVKNFVVSFIVVFLYEYLTEKNDLSVIYIFSFLLQKMVFAQ